jgi:hypothetical protein
MGKRIESGFPDAQDVRGEAPGIPCSTMRTKPFHSADANPLGSVRQTGRFEVELFLHPPHDLVADDALVTQSYQHAAFGVDRL